MNNQYLTDMHNTTKRLIGALALLLPLSATAWAEDGDDYPVNFPAGTTITNAGRATREVGLSLPPSTAISVIMTQQESTRLLYTDCLAQFFSARPGETVKPYVYFTYSGPQPWMHSYVYLDRGNDGTFSAEINEDGTPVEGCDLMSYSYYNGKNSSGATANAGTSIQAPEFVVPDLPVGYYRMRYKVDWDNFDPAGCTDPSNLITKNGGSIVDVRLNVHGDVVRVSAKPTDKGTILVNDKKPDGALEFPYGEVVQLKVKPASDTLRLSYVRVRRGYNLDGDSLVHGTPQYIDELIPAYLFKNGRLTRFFEDGEVLLEPVFTKKADALSEYGRNFADDLASQRTDRKLNAFTLRGSQTGNATTVSLDADSRLIYNDLTGKNVWVKPGEEVSVDVDFTGRAMHHYLYVDLDNDGCFVPDLDANGVPTVNSELLSFTYYNGKNSRGVAIESAPGEVSVDSLPSFTLPMLNDGIYRARLVTDWNSVDAGGRWAEGAANNIDANGGSVVDFLLNVNRSGSASIKLLTINGSIYAPDNGSLPWSCNAYEPLAVVPTPAVDGYEAEKMTIRHGYNLYGPQYDAHGNRQWSVFEVPATAYTIPADSVNGAIEIEVNFEPTASAKYQLVFSDEFNEGSVPDPEKWSCSPRQNATWNRWIADDERVACLSGGNFVARAIPNPDPATYQGDMITGAIQSRGKFAFKYGKIEARIYTNGWTGNFPAFWLMPEDQTGGWPACGEIDIWEQINNEQRAYHTLHTGYRQSMYSVSEYCNTSHFHTYGFEWDAEKMIWYMDGREVGRYNKSANYPAHPDSWPYDKAFYIILNQSVGSGSWAANPDINQTYTTLFDWVRVYQTDEQTAVQSVPVAAPSDQRIYDLQGREVTNPTKGGIYVRAGRKVML